MVMRSPVRGLRPGLAGRFLTEKVPNPAMATASSWARPSPMAVKTALTRLSAAAFDNDDCAATRKTMSDLFMSRSLELYGQDRTGAAGSREVVHVHLP